MISCFEIFNACTQKKKKKEKKVSAVKYGTFCLATSIFNINEKTKKKRKEAISTEADTQIML